MANNFDRRITPARPDLAAASLQGKVEALRFVTGEEASIAVGRASLRAAPSAEAAQDSELLHGERVTVYERKDGWAWVQAANDGYVGYVCEGCLAAPFTVELQVSALMTPVYMRPDLKSPVRDMLPMTCEVNLRARDGDYLAIAPDAWVHRFHVAMPAEVQPDFVAVAESFFGVPYVWGGKTFAGADCSGLIQTALAASGIRAPRDTDMMERHFADTRNPTLDRGDILFWKGHMGVMLDTERLLHANAFHMMTAIEPVTEAIARIEKTSGPVTSVKTAR
jgi:cell wall-associated NlpC family hydrolase